MRLDGRRLSNNVSDQRGKSSGGKLIGGGIGTIIVAAIVFFMSGGDIGQVMNVIGQQGGAEGQSEYVETESQRQLAQFASQILAGTEDVWTEQFRKNGWGEYRAPKMVLFSGATSSACGNATSQVGPFYCSGDETVYIDLSFFEQMEDQMKAGGDFAYAYVIAHEVGHHVQHLLGILDQAHQQMNRADKTTANQISVRLELQADFFAGVWGNNDNKMFNSLEPGDVEEAINAASKIGDDFLQKQAYGYDVPDSFTHGTSAQRKAWLTKGLRTGDPNQGDTFSQPYNQL